MLTVVELEKRLANLAQQAEQALSQYHVILGSKMTMEQLLAEAKKGEQVIEAVEDVEKVLENV
jgi:hypothetical protein